MKKLFYSFTMIFIVLFTFKVNAKDLVSLKIKQFDRTCIPSPPIFAPKVDNQSYGKTYVKILNSVHSLQSDGTGKFKDSTLRVSLFYDKTKNQYVYSNSYDFLNAPKKDVRIVSSNYSKFNSNDAIDIDVNSINGAAGLVSKEQYFIAGKWNDSSNTTTVLDSKNNPTVTTNKYGDNGILVDYNRTRYLYDGLLKFVGTETDYYNTSTKKWDLSDGAKEQYVYDSKNNIVACSTLVLNGTTLKYDVISKQTYTLLADGSVSSGVKYEFDPSTKKFIKRDSIGGIEWQVFNKVRSYLYTGAPLKVGGLLTKKFTTYSLDSSAKWVPNEQYIYSYDSKNNITKATIATYNTDSSRFIVDFIINNAYYPNGDLKYKDQSTKKSGVFLVDYIQNYYNTYNSDGDIVTSYSKEEGSTITYSDKTFYYYGAVVGIEDQENRYSSLNIYPNPVTDILNIQSNGKNITMLEVISMDGKVMKSVQNPIKNGSTYSLSVSELQNGIYFLRNISNSTISVNRFIKQ